MSIQISLIQQMEHHKAETWGIRFSMDGKRLVSSDGGALYLWQQSESGRWEYERLLPFRQAALPCFSPDGTMLAFGDQEKLVRLISLDGREIAALPYHSQATWAFSPDQRWLVSGDTARNILFWDLQTYEYSSLSPLPGIQRSGYKPGSRSLERNC